MVTIIKTVHALLPHKMEGNRSQNAHFFCTVDGVYIAKTETGVHILYCINLMVLTEGAFQLLCFVFDKCGVSGK